MLSALSQTGAFAGGRPEFASPRATGPRQTDIAITLLHASDGKPVTEMLSAT
jgi:hypothetical protein